MQRLLWCFALAFLLNGTGCDTGSSEVTVVKDAPPMPEDTTCVVSGEPSKPQYTVQYRGRYYYLCCKKCIRAFKAEPDRYALPEENTTGQQAHAH